MTWLLTLTHLITIPAAMFVGVLAERHHQRRQFRRTWEEHVTQTLELTEYEPPLPVPCRAGCGRTASIRGWCIGCAPAGLLTDQPFGRDTL